MKSRTLACATAITLFALAQPLQLAAQQPNETNSSGHKYVFAEVPTFGGPNAYGAQTSAKDNSLNNAGALTGGADTADADPYCSPNGPDCFAEHAFTFHNGILRDLGTLPGGTFPLSSQAFWINESGTAVGFSQNGVIDPLTPNFPELRAVVWSNGKIIELGTFGGNHSMAQAVNNRDQVVGFALNAVPDSIEPQPLPTEMHAFLWDNGVMQDLGTLGGPDSWAMFINDRGQVAGISYPDSEPSSVCDTPGKNHAFLWEKGHMQDVGTLGGTCSWPEALSNQGQIVGWSAPPGDLTLHPFLWERGKIRDLGTLGGSFGVATWVNDLGEVIGSATTENDETLLGFVWKNGVMTALEPLPGDCVSEAYRNNSRGQIIGASISCDGSFKGVLWENGTVTDLNTFVPPGSALEINAGVLYLNDRGEIAGSDVLLNGDFRFFTLTPVSTGEAASKTSAARSSDNPFRNAPHGRLTPEMLAALRARLSSRYHICGLVQPKN